MCILNVNVTFIVQIFPSVIGTHFLLVPPLGRIQPTTQYDSALFTPQGTTHYCWGTEAAWNEFAWLFFTWSADRIEPQTFWSQVKHLIHFATCPGIRLPLLNGYHARSLHWKYTPFHWFWGGGGGITPYFSQNEDFCCKKNHPFFSGFKESTLRDDHFWNKLRTFITVVIHIFRMIFLLPSSSCGHIRTLYILKM